MIVNSGRIHDVPANVPLLIGEGATITLGEICGLVAEAASVVCDLGLAEPV